jgi:Uma2 family endonuclease
MSNALRQPMTTREFLEWEERQPLRYEFDGWHPVGMTDGTDTHEAIGGTLRAMLQDRLRGRPCRVRGPTLKIEVMGRIRYPDAFIYCTPVAPNETVIREPVVVFEVLSPGTSRTDRIEKLREYQSTPSILRYIILEQDSIAAMIFARRGADWTTTVATAGETLSMPEIGIELPLSDIYAGVTLPPVTEEASDEP